MSTIVRWPPERFYWSVLHAPQWRRSGTLPPGLRAELEGDLPVPAESVHAVGVPISEGRLLVCAADAASLGEAPHETLVLTPESVPEFAVGGGRLPDPSALNLLVGAHEPRALSRARRSRHSFAMATVLLLAGLITVGLVRRATVWDTAAADASAALGSIQPDIAPEVLAQEVARLERLRASSERIRPPADAAVTLASLLRTWPASVPSRPQTLAVTESGVSVSVALDGDATAFLKAMTPPAGWTMDEPRLNAADKITRLTLQMRPSREAPP